MNYVLIIVIGIANLFMGDWLLGGSKDRLDKLVSLGIMATSPALMMGSLMT